MIKVLIAKNHATDEKLAIAMATTMVKKGLIVPVSEKAKKKQKFVPGGLYWFPEDAGVEVCIFYSVLFFAITR